MPACSPIDTMRLIEYRLKGLSYEDIGALVDLAPSTVVDRLQRHQRLIAAAGEADAFENVESKVLSGARSMLLARVVDCASAQSGEPDALSGYQAMGMYGIAFDKWRILEGKSTSNVAVLTRIVNDSEQTGDIALRKLSVETVSLNKVSQSVDDSELP